METIKKTTFDRIYALSLAQLVANKGSFRAVAKQLDTSPSNISKEIAKLEQYLDVKIFTRTTRSLSITEEGLILLDKAKLLLNTLDDLEDEIKGNKMMAKGPLRITAPNSLGQGLISKVIAKFQKLNPYVEIDIIFTDRILDPIENRIDLSIRTGFNLPDSNFYAREIGTLKRVICASPKYIENFKRPKNIESLSNHNCLLYMRGASPFHWTFRKKDIFHDISVQGSFRSNNLYNLIDACLEGIGLLNIPYYLVKNDIEEERLIPILKSWSLPEHSVFLITTQKPTHSRRIESLVNFLEENLIFE